MEFSWLLCRLLRGMKAAPRDGAGRGHQPFGQCVGQLRRSACDAAVPLPGGLMLAGDHARHSRSLSRVFAAAVAQFRNEKRHRRPQTFIFCRRRSLGRMTDITRRSHANGTDSRRHSASVRMRTELIRASTPRVHGSLHATAGGGARGDDAWEQNHRTRSAPPPTVRALKGQTHVTSGAGIDRPRSYPGLKGGRRRLFSRGFGKASDDFRSVSAPVPRGRRNRRGWVASEPRVLAAGRTLG